FDELQDVLLGDTAAEAGAGDLGKTYSVLACDLPDERRGASLFFIFLNSGPGGGLRRGGRGFLFVGLFFCRLFFFRLCVGRLRRGGLRGSGFAVYGDGS